MVYKEILATPNIPPGQGVFTFYGSATIKAPAEQAWNALLDFKAYSKWNLYTPSIDAPSNGKPIAVGDKIALQYRPEPTGTKMTVPCTIIAISEEERSLCWRGEPNYVPSFMILAEKIQKITPKSESECLFEIYETQGRYLAYVVKWRMGEQLSAMNQGIADGLKKYVEAL